MTGSFVIAAHRTPVAPRGGKLSHLLPHELAAPTIRACLSNAGLDASNVDELIAGNALGAGGNPARLVALAAGLPETVAGLSIDRQCCGGLDALLLADAMIKAGQAKIVIAGGVESYSRRPLRYATSNDGTPPLPYDQPPFSPWPNRDPDMAEAADALAQKLGISKQLQDTWAIESHKKALAAGPRLSAEIVAHGALDHDAYTRNLTQGLCDRAKVISGSITTANTSVAADAAAFCLIVSEDIAAKFNGSRMRIMNGATLGAAPELPGLAPVAPINSALSKANFKPSDISVAEIMEAYAAQAIACVEQAGIDEDVTNLGGGSLARGHPIGASGAILAVRLFHELTARNGVGLAAIAAAGGLGTAVLFEA